MDTSGLTGSDLEDKLLQDVLLYSCMTDTVYSSGYEDWVAYSDPIPAEPVTLPEHHALTEPPAAPTPETLPETTPETTPEPTPEPTPIITAPVLNAYDNVSVTGTSDVDTTVSVHFDFEGVTTSYSVIAGPDGLFEYTLTDPVAVGTIITAVASDAAGNISAVSNSITI
jgi:hypothetical protein